MTSELDNLITDMGQGSRRRGVKRGVKRSERLFEDPLLSSPQKWTPLSNSTYSNIINRMSGKLFTTD